MGEAAGIYYAAADAKLKNRWTLSRARIPTARRRRMPKASSRARSWRSLTSPRWIPPTIPTKNSPSRFRLKRRPDAKIDSPNDVVIHVFFYDLLDDGSVVQTDANMTYRLDARFP